jgi:hypothetical protein
MFSLMSENKRRKERTPSYYKRASIFFRNQFHCCFPKQHKYRTEFLREFDYESESESEYYLNFRGRRADV